MKIIFLNTWNGRQHEELRAFLIEHIPTTDIFCLQEVHEEMRLLCSELLTEYAEVYAHKRMPRADDTRSSVRFSQATFVRQPFTITDTITLFPAGGNTGLGLYTEITYADKIFHIMNVHGITKHGDDKKDTKDRILQSRACINLLKDKVGARIIGGDFNIDPDTESISMFAAEGYRDCIATYHIKTTRNELAWARYPVKMLHSDYVFVREETTITQFTVPHCLISDHLPLIVEI